jgi:tetratricopeptide (TPR) repeat protein
MQLFNTIEEEKRNLLFSLEGLDEPTVVFVAVNSIQKEKELLTWFQENINKQQHFILDINNEHVTSLFERLQQFYKENTNIKPLDYVHVLGLENAIDAIQDDEVKNAHLIKALNYDRENFFYKLPFSTVLWADKYFFTQLNKEAPDFTHWVTKWFEFLEPEIETKNDDTIEAPPHKGKTAERTDYIIHLENQFNALDLNTDDKKRLFKDKATLSFNLGLEYEKQNDYNKAIKYFTRALDFSNKINDESLQAEIQFYLGRTYSKTENFELSQKYYFECLNYCKNNNINNLGNIYHQLGMLYTSQLNWDLALINYNEAIFWKNRKENKLALSRTYHQIGILYHKQEIFHLALENYNMALKLKISTNDEDGLGITYNQIGDLYCAQEKWQLALEYYQLALKSKIKIGYFYELGNTYHQLSIFYIKQKNINEFIKYNNLSIANYTKYNNPMLEKAISLKELIIQEMNNQPPTSSSTD